MDAPGKPQRILIVWLKILGMVTLAAGAEMAIWQWYGKGYRRQKALETIKVIPGTLVMGANKDKVAVGATVSLNSRSAPFSRVVFVFDLKTAETRYLDLQIHESISMAMSEDGRWIAVGIHGHSPRILDVERFAWSSLPLPASQADITALSQNKLDDWQFGEGQLFCANQNQLLGWSLSRTDGDDDWQAIPNVEQYVSLESMHGTETKPECVEPKQIKQDEKIANEVLQHLTGGVLTMDGEWHELELSPQMRAELLAFAEVF